MCADFVQLVYRAIHERGKISRNAGQAGKTGKQLSVGDADRELGQADRGQDFTNHRDRFRICRRRRRADDIRVTLPELPKSPALRLFRAEDRSNVIPLEWKWQIVLVVGDKVVPIANKDKVAEFHGKKVTVTGTSDGFSYAFE